MAAILTMDSKLTCGYCCQFFKDMVDPRELPCGHVNCRNCMHMDYNEHNGVICPECKTFHELINIGDLKTATVDRVEVNAKTTLICDHSKCQDKPAVSFCVDCGNTLCDTHQQTHNAYFEDTHQVIYIEVYEQSPGKYKKVFCDKHKKEALVKACRLCYRLVCNECDRAEGDCSDISPQHDYRTLGALVEEITSRFTQQQELVEAKMKDIYKLDKESWRQLDVFEERCGQWIAEVERVRDEQVEQVNEQCEKVKAKIREYLREVTTQVETYNSDLIANKESLEELRNNVHRLMRDGHMTDKIRQKQQMTEKLMKSLNVDLGSCELTKNATFVTKESSTDDWCYSADHREDGDILVHCIQGVRLLSKNSMEVIKYHLPYKKIHAAVEHRHVVYILHREFRTQKVEMCLPNLEHAQTLFEFENSSAYSASMAVSDRYIVVRNPVGFPERIELIIYDFFSKQTKITPIKFTNVNLYLLPDGHLIVPKGRDQLVKYYIENGELTADSAWTCEGLKGIDTVCADPDGLIYASTTLNEKLLYIISPRGEKLAELTHDRLPVTPGQISIRGDELAVPGWNDEKLYLFRLNQ